VVDLPTPEVGAADVPPPALAVRGQEERALLCPHQNPYSAHPFLLPEFQEMPAGELTVSPKVPQGDPTSGRAPRPPPLNTNSRGVWAFVAHGSQPAVGAGAYRPTFAASVSRRSKLCDHPSAIRSFSSKARTSADSKRSRIVSLVLPPCSSKVTV